MFGSKFLYNSETFTRCQNISLCSVIKLSISFVHMPFLSNQKLHYCFSFSFFAEAPGAGLLLMIIYQRNSPAYDPPGQIFLNVDVT